MEDTTLQPTQQEQLLQLNLSKEEIALLAQVLKTIPIQGNLEQVGALYTKLTDIITRLDNLTKEN